ncbi:protein canopy 4-like [Corticium candelabrum]|uniref:protein canopy 4-like n=1 Tax=Corticium candelabrum TaxID=121492 RepID=UPI002E272EC3|nr:protein canopy 4-like [Corticium candelabrum]
MNLLIFLFLFDFSVSIEGTESEREPTPCEVCKFLSAELTDELDKTGSSKSVVATGSRLNVKGEWSEKKTTEYRKSEVRLVEAIERVCEKMLGYSVHTDRPERYAKGRSETMSTLHALRDKGVKVDLGIPDEMWDKTPAEISKLRLKCDNMVEEYEDELFEWYFKHQDKDLQTWLCKDKVLSSNQQECLVPKSKKKSKKGSTDFKGKDKQKKKEVKKNDKNERKHKSEL